MYKFLLFLAFMLAFPPLYPQPSVQKTGYQSFREVVFPIHEAEFVRLWKEGQAPKTLFIGCSDSRVIPELITNAGPGQIFVIRNAGNFVPTSENATEADGIAASMEFAIKVLGVREIIICGHTHCGAIEGLFADPKMIQKELPLVSKWLQNGREAEAYTIEKLGKNASKEELARACEKISVVYQISHLLTYPFIKEKVENREIYLHGWLFNIANGAVEYYDPVRKEFLPLGK